MTLSTDESRFTIVLVFECHPDEQSAFVDMLHAFVEARIKPREGFVSALIYASEDGHHIVEHFQWRDQASYLAYRRSLDGQEGFDWLSRRNPHVLHLQLKAAVT